MARLSPAKPHGLDLVRRYTYRTARKMYGKPTEPAQVIAHHRPSLIGYGVAGLMHERYSRTVDRRLKHLAMLRTSQLTGCEWCLDFGSKLAQESGIDEETLRELSTWRTPVDVSDELFAQLREHFDEPQLVELTMAIGLENLFSRTNWALGIHGEDFSEGMYCVRPELAAVEDEVAAR